MKYLFLGCIFFMACGEPQKPKADIQSVSQNQQGLRNSSGDLPMNVPAHLKEDDSPRLTEAYCKINFDKLSESQKVQCGKIHQAKD